MSEQDLNRVNPGVFQPLKPAKVKGKGKGLW
jgi:hypothetical protein